MVVDCVENRLKDSIWRDDGKLLEMALQMPSKSDCWQKWKKYQKKSLVDLNGMSTRIISINGLYLTRI